MAETTARGEFSVTLKDLHLVLPATDLPPYREFADKKVLYEARLRYSLGCAIPTRSR